MVISLTRIMLLAAIIIVVATNIPVFALTGIMYWAYFAVVLTGSLFIHDFVCKTIGLVPVKKFK